MRGTRRGAPARDVTILGNKKINGMRVF